MRTGPMRPPSEGYRRRPLGGSHAAVGRLIPSEGAGPGGVEASHRAVLSSDAMAGRQVLRQLLAPWTGDHSESQFEVTDAPCVGVTF
jgi:hypothetical protein